MRKKIKLQVGMKVVLDKGCRNSSIVEIIAIGPFNMIATVRSLDGLDEWDVLCCRLSRRALSQRVRARKIKMRFNN